MLAMLCVIQCLVVLILVAAIICAKLHNCRHIVMMHLDVRLLSIIVLSQTQLGHVCHLLAL